MRNKEVVNIYVIVWVGLVIATLTVFGLVKVGSLMFNMPPAGVSNTQQCWQRGGTPVLGTHGDANSFLKCDLTIGRE